nr:PREDICTED: neuropeptides capa receptor-like [Bemisia tabaci]
MHTATNFYLFSLAVSDLLLLVSGLPFEMYTIWHRYEYAFSEAFCVLQGYAAETSANATVLTITAFTMERYVAICHPFLTHTVSKLSRAISFIIGIWLLALCLAVPQAIQFGIVYESRNETNSGEYAASCTIKWVLMKHAFEISTCLFFITPMTLITVLYILIGVKLRGSKMLKRSSVTSVSAERKNVRSQNHVIRMLVAVVVAFFLCWAPFHAQRLLAVHLASNENETPNHAFTIFYSILTYTSGILYYLSATINPLLYNIMSKKFRDAFKNMLGQGYCCFGRPALQQRNNSVSRGHSATQSYMDSHLLNNTVHTSTEVPKTRSGRIMARLSLAGGGGRSRTPRGQSNGAAKAAAGAGAGQELLRGPPKPQGRPLPKAQERNNASFKSTLTISNSSLQDLDDSEYSGLELANYMGELNKQ